MSPEEREIEQKMVKVISQMPASVQNRFKVLHMLSDERSKINDEFEKEVKALEAKFMERKKPLLQKRNDIVLGKITEFAEYLPKYELTQKANEEIVVGVVKSEKDKAEDEEEAKTHTPTDVTHLKGVAGIPDFWATAIKNNQMMMQTIREKDADTLQYITNVEASETQEPRTVTIKIYYKENEYFTNPHLELMVRFKDDQQDEVVETQGTLIDWKDGKDLSKKKIKKKQKNKKTGETRTIIKTVPADSFYNAFESRKAPEGVEDDDDEDEETAKILDALDETM